MKKLIPTLFLLTLSLATISAIAAVNVVECEDVNGNRAFYKICPPDTKMIGEKKLSTGLNDEEKSSIDINATIYIIPDCDTCEEVMEFLQGRHISITKKIIDKNLELQTELTKLTGGLKVPTTVIGDSVVIGYNRAELKAALKENGYTKEDS